ncbi:divergent polysaccharide deacetylase family protein [Sulfurimonas sp.]|uniref:divergent polysaccharide deacetylase family protein n=1 Tax=Sulfurimonas sp. TaxID=2022749 RepID=UPI002606ACEC|nr:divergent polysaccharide deacetylase family protein [Sulfurimonas sp.]
MPRKKSTKNTKTKKVIKKTHSNILVYIAWFLAILALILISLLIGYYVGISEVKPKGLTQEQALKHSKTLLKTSDEKLTKKEKPVVKRLQEVLKNEQKDYESAAHEIDSEKLANPIPVKHKKVVVYHHKPKLAIIIDDVQTKSQIDAIKKLHLTLTMSFLPPRKARPYSAKLAAKEKFYMVHLPMEAMHFSAAEPDTLLVHDSQTKILQKIRQIKKEFPRAHYINNHTGSKFTSNEVAMNRLIFALNESNIRFIDSRTTAKTMAPRVLENFGLKYVARDVFLDHKMDKSYVKKQIKKAIAVAKRNGHAIAICHPHKNTLAALAESKALFKDVDLVQVNEVY